jgi:hypothetical protein
MASPPGAVPPPPDGEPDLPPGIAPPPEHGVSAYAAAADLGAASGAGWAGSADAHAAAWAAYQQQYAYQHAGADWGAYHAAWANEWARHNEAAAAAAAAPSAERLAAVAAKIAEQIAEKEKDEKRRPAATTTTATTTTPNADPSGVLPVGKTGEVVEKQSQKETNATVVEKQTRRQASSMPQPPPPKTAPPSPPPPPSERTQKRIWDEDDSGAPSARFNRDARRDESKSTGRKHPPALIPRQIPPAHAPRGALGVEPRRARAASWQDVAADALLANKGADSKRFVEEERKRLLCDIETSRARLSDDKKTPRGPPAFGTHESSERRLVTDSIRGFEEDDPRRERRRTRKRAKDFAYWERHYAAKHGIPLDEDEKGFGFEAAVSDPREGSSAAATATTTPDVETRAAAFDADQEKGRGVGSFSSREKTRRASPRDPRDFSSRETRPRSDARRGDGDGGERYVGATRARPPRTLTAARASRAWGPNGTPPDSPESESREGEGPEGACSPSRRDDVGARLPEDDARKRRRLSRDANSDANDVTDDRSSSVVVLRGLTTREELMDPSEAEEIEKETALECAAFGEVREVRVVRPNPLGEAFDPEDVGFVFLRFADDAAAERAQKSLHGRTFADRPVVAEFVRRGGDGASRRAA